VPEELLREMLPPRPASAWSWPEAACPEAEAAIAWSSEAANAEAASAKATDAQGAATAQEAVSLSPRQRRGEQQLIRWILRSSE